MEDLEKIKLSWVDKTKDSENKLIGLLQKETHLIQDLPVGMTPNYFNNKINQRIFYSLKKLSDSKKEISFDSLSQILVEVDNFSKEKILFDKNQYDEKLTERILESGIENHFEQYIKHITESYKRRKIEEKLLEASDKIKQSSEDYQDIVLEAETSINKLIEEGIVIEEVSLDQLIKSNFEIFMETKGKREKMITGWSDFDELTNGFRKGTLAVIMARPSMGKTAVAFDMAIRFAQRGKNTLIFSVEMDRQEIYDRTIAYLTGINTKEITDYNKVIENKHDEKIKQVIEKVKSYNLDINFEPRMSVEKIRQEVRRIKKDKGLDVIFIDYFQKLKAMGFSPEATTSMLAEISMELKAIAKEFDISVVLLAQLNRNNESRENKRPSMSDIKGTGGIEQDADVIIGLYRDDYYQKDKTDLSTVQTTEFIVAKNRNGGSGTIKMSFDMNKSKFSELGRMTESQIKDNESIQFKELTETPIQAMNNVVVKGLIKRVWDKETDTGTFKNVTLQTLKGSEVLISYFDDKNNKIISDDSYYEFKGDVIYKDFHKKYIVRANQFKEIKKKKEENIIELNELFGEGNYE